MTSVLTDEEVVVDVDMDATLPCMAPSCSAEAKWACKCPKCRHEVIACDMHQRQVDALDQVVIIAGGTVCCISCDAPVPFPATWRPI